MARRACCLLDEHPTLAASTWRLAAARWRAPRSPRPTWMSLGSWRPAARSELRALSGRCRCALPRAASRPAHAARPRGREQLADCNLLPWTTCRRNWPRACTAGRWWRRCGARMAARLQGRPGGFWRLTPTAPASRRRAHRCAPRCRAKLGLVPPRPETACSKSVLHSACVQGVTATLQLEQWWPAGADVVVVSKVSGGDGTKAAKATGLRLVGRSLVQALDSLHLELAG